MPQPDCRSRKSQKPQGSNRRGRPFGSTDRRAGPNSRSLPGKAPADRAPTTKRGCEGPSAWRSFAHAPDAQPRHSRLEKAFRPCDGEGSSTSRQKTRSPCFSFRRKRTVGRSPHVPQSAARANPGALQPPYWARRWSSGDIEHVRWGSPACLGGKRVRLFDRQAGLKRRPLGFLGGSRRRDRVSVSSSTGNYR